MDNGISAGGNLSINPKNMTQKEVILERLRSVGYVDNFWAIKNNILRLGARIYDLIQDGYDFQKGTGRELEKPKRFHKNFYYYLIKNKNGKTNNQ